MSKPHTTSELVIFECVPHKKEKKEREKKFFHFNFIPENLI